MGQYLSVLVFNICDLLYQYISLFLVVGGDFVYWDNEALLPKRVPAAPGSGSAVDGSKLVHAASIYQRSVTPPRLNKVYFYYYGCWLLHLL